MNLLYRLRDVNFASKDNRRISPLRAWLCTHAMSSLDKYQQLEVSGFSSPLVFQSETPMRKIIAYIDPENKFTTEDKLSQVGLLQNFVVGHFRIRFQKVV
jgi:carbonic anhydrase